MISKKKLLFFKICLLGVKYEIKCNIWHSTISAHVTNNSRTLKPKLVSFYKTEQKYKITNKNLKITCKNDR